MTTNLGQIYASVLLRSGKDLRGGYITPTKFNDAIYFINERKLNDLVDHFEKNQEVTNDLQPFIKTLGSPQYAPLSFTPVLSTDVNKGGYATIPSDYWYECRANYTKIVNLGCTSNQTYGPINFVKQHEFDAIMSDSNDSPVIDPVNNYPVLVIQNDLFYIYPYISRCSFTYIREAATPYFDYDIISGIPVYLPPGEVHVNSSVLPAGTPSQSVEFEYTESLVDSLIDMIRAYVAIDNQSEWNLQTQPKPKNL